MRVHALTQSEQCAHVVLLLASDRQSAVNLLLDFGALGVQRLWCRFLVGVEVGALLGAGRASEEGVVAAELVRLKTSTALELCVNSFADAAIRPPAKFLAQELLPKRAAIRPPEKEMFVSEKFQRDTPTEKSHRTLCGRYGREVALAAKCRRCREASTRVRRCVHRE